MSEAAPATNKRERRKQRKRAERQGERDLDDLTTDAIEAVLAVVADVAAAPRTASERLVDVSFRSRNDARYAIKRINEQLSVGEWLDDVEVWLWDADVHHRAPLSEHGRTNGFELRVERRAEPAR